MNVQVMTLITVVIKVIILKIDYLVSIRIL